MSAMLPGVEHAIMKIADLMPQLLRELEKLNQNIVNQNFEKNLTKIGKLSSEDLNEVAERFRQFDLEPQVSTAGLLSTDEAAQRLRISRRKLLEMTRAGDLPSIKVPGTKNRLFHTRDVEEFLDDCVSRKEKDQ